MRKLNDRSEMQAPGICFVCECAPQGEVVDTNANFTAGFPSSLEGRKYICDGCVKGAAGVLGLVSSEKQEQATADAAVANAQRQNVIDNVRAFAQAVVDGKLEEDAARVVVFAEDSEPEVAPPLVQDEVAPEEYVEPNAIEAPQAVGPVEPKKVPAKKDA